MPSRLQLQATFDEPTVAKAIYRTSPTLPPAKKQRMSLTQTYYVASTARSKLGREAGRADHNLRRLVGHANLLDTLMLELADAEREQEAWFNQSVKRASKPEEPRRVQWIDSIPEEEFADDSDSDADSETYDEDEDEDEDIEMTSIPLRRIRSPPVQISSAPVAYDSESEESDLELIEDVDSESEELALARVPSKTLSSPPELTLDSEESEDEDESMPSSPEQPSFELSAKERQAIASAAPSHASSPAGFFDDLKAQQEQHYMMHQPQQPLITSY